VEMAEPTIAAVDPANLSTSGAPGSDALRRARDLREEEKLAEAAEVLAVAVEQAVAEQGTDVHPALAELWFEYGDVLLELEEEEDQEPEDKDAEDAGHGDAAQEEAGTAIDEPDGRADAGVMGEGGASSLEIPAAVDPEEQRTEECAEAAEDEEAEDDLQLAWECLETARRCFEAQEGGRGALSKVHLRLADLLMMQNRAEEAVEEYRTSLLLRLSNPGEPRAQSASDDASTLCAVARDGFVRLCMALVRAGRAASFTAAAADAQQLLAGLGDDLVRHLGASSSALPATSAEGPASDGAGGPVAQVTVRKRKREEDPLVIADACKARTSD